MNTIQCFKTIPGTQFDQAVKKHLELRPRWSQVVEEVAELFEEPIRSMAFDTQELYVDLDEIKNPDTKKLFTKNGKLVKNKKEANALRKIYFDIIKKHGLQDFMEMRMINFVYGVMRRSDRQSLERFITSEHDIYFKANYNLEADCEGLVESITHIEYEEKYLEELKKRESEDA